MVTGERRWGRLLYERESTPDSFAPGRGQKFSESLSICHPSFPPIQSLYPPPYPPPHLHTSFSLSCAPAPLPAPAAPGRRGGKRHYPTPSRFDSALKSAASSPSSPPPPPPHVAPRDGFGGPPPRCPQSPDCLHRGGSGADAGAGGGRGRVHEHAGAAAAACRPPVSEGGWEEEGGSRRWAELESPAIPPSSSSLPPCFLSPPATSAPATRGPLQQHFDPPPSIADRPTPLLFSSHFHPHRTPRVAPPVDTPSLGTRPISGMPGPTFVLVRSLGVPLKATA